MRLRTFFLLSIICLPCFAQQSADVTRHAIDSLKKALLYARHDSTQLKLRYQIGVVSGITRLPYWDSLLADTRRKSSLRMECMTLSHLGYLSISATSPDVNKALEYYNKSMAIALSTGFKSMVVHLVKSLIVAYQGGNEGRKMLDACYTGLKVAEEIGDKRSAADFYSAIANHYFFLNDINKALDMHFNCLHAYKTINDPVGIAGTLTDIASDYHALGDDKKAVHYYLASGKYAGQLGETMPGAYICNAMASGYELMQEADSAYKYSSRSYEICRRMNTRHGMASAMVVMAKATFQKGDIARAEKMTIEAIALAKSVGFLVQLPDLLLFLKKIHLKMGDPGKALEDTDLYLAMRDSITNDKNRKRALQQEFDYNFEKKENENKLLAQQNQIQLLQLKQNRYFLVLLGALLLAVLVVAYLLLRQNKLQTGHQKIQLEQKILRSQMNPHFIFNSLNSIQQFIISRQNDHAELYLSKFSNLIRELLESNIKESLSVREEADILRGYVEMEALRFRNAFSFSLNIDERIDQERSQIPHMMIQPFVENAIWHGLLPKQSDRHLLVSFEPGPDRTIQCTVEDNGIGRDTASKKEPVRKKSLAISFIRQRIQLMKKTLNAACRMDIIDKRDEAGMNTGTKVIVILPLLNN